MIDESRIDISKTWYFGNNRSKNLRVSPPKWSAPFFLTTSFQYAEDYSDYGVYKIDLKPEASSNILDFNKQADVKILRWPKVLVDKIREGRNDLNSIAYDMYILAYSTGDLLMYIEDNAQWTQAAEYFKKKSKNIFVNVDITSSVWGTEKDHLFLLQMWKDIYDSGFNGFMHTEFGNKVLAIFNFNCIDKISISPVKLTLNEDNLQLNALFNVPLSRFKREIENADINNKYFNKAQFEKLYDCNCEWSLLFDNEECVAAAAIVSESWCLMKGFAYVNELQSLKSGKEYGKQLLLKLKEHYKFIWLMADPSVENDLLLMFYRDPDFDFAEHVLPADESRYGVDTHFFATKDNIDEEKWHEFLMLHYGNEKTVASLSESNDYNEQKLQKLINEVVSSYNELFGIDLSYMKFIVDKQPVYNNGESCYEYLPDECAGDWTKLGYIRLNPDMQSVMERYGLSWHSTADIENFTKIIIAHELAHEIWNNIASNLFKQDIVIKANNASFTTTYLRTVNENKLDEEMFCEYLAHLVVQLKKEMSFPEEEINDLSRRRHIVTHRVSDDIDLFNLDDIVIAPWGIAYKVIRKQIISNVNDSPYARYLTLQQKDFLKDFDLIAVIELDAVYDPPYTLDLIKQHYSDDIYRQLSACPIHSWRANTGIELIHKEPTEDELERIWKNWQLMPQDMKDVSDLKSIELFGCTNAEHYKQLKSNNASSIDEEEGIADNDIYLANMAKSFADKAWFLKDIPEGIDTIVDFGGGAGDFAKYCLSKKPGLKYVIIDNNADFASKAEERGFFVSPGLQELKKSGIVDFSKALLNMSSVIHEVYSYADPFYDDVGVFWTDVQKCGFKAIAIRDMSYDLNSMRNAPTDAILWIYENVLKSLKIRYKDKPFKEITDSFESVWGDICDTKIRKVNYKNLMHFLIKYRYQENWAREVEENYLPVSKDKLASILTDMGYKFKHKESSKLEFYGKCWKKDFKLNIPDNNNYRQQFYLWLLTLDTHIKWLLEKPNSIINEDNSKSMFYRFCYNDTGIYEAVKHKIFKDNEISEAKKKWQSIVKASSWLPKPKLEYNSHKSWFTEKGKDIFVKKVLPLLLEYLSKDKIKIIRRNKVVNIAYLDEYQVVEN